MDFISIFPFPGSKVGSISTRLAPPFLLYVFVCACGGGGVHVQISLQKVCTLPKAGDLHNKIQGFKASYVRYWMP